MFPNEMPDGTKQEVRDVVGRIQHKENSGDNQGAASELLEAIKRSGEPGKWQAFMDALREVCVQLMCGVCPVPVRLLNCYLAYMGSCPSKSK